jgi:hypothetical protein
MLRGIDGMTTISNDSLVKGLPIAPAEESPGGCETGWVLAESRFGFNSSGVLSS